jgi:hypothetical protein
MELEVKRMSLFIYFYILLSVIFIGLFLYSFSKKKHPYLLYFGLFLALMSVNLFGVQMQQDPIFLKFLSYGASAFFLLFYQQIFGSGFKNIHLRLWQLHLVSWAAIVVCAITNIFSLEDSYFPYSILNIATVLYIAISTILKAHSGDQDAKIFTFGLLGLIFTLLIDISFAVKASNYAPTQSTTWGLLVFTICLSVILFKRFIQKGSEFIYDTFTFQHDPIELKMKADSMVMHSIKNEIQRLMYLNERNHRFLTDPEQLGRNFNNIDETLKHMNEMIQTFTKTEHVVLHPRTIPINPIILDAVKGSQNLVDIELNLGAEPVMEIDSLHFKECITNLVSNSIEAIEHSNGKIQISLFQKNREAILEISDNGKGIPPENIKDVITPLFTTKKSSTHFGVGLYYVYYVVSKHGGTLTIPYSEVGKGTTIQIRLPIKSIRRWSKFGKNQSYAG